MKYLIEIQETLSRVIEVEANSYEEAEQQVIDCYDTGDIVLDANDFVGAYFINLQDKITEAWQETDNE